MKRDPAQSLADVDVHPAAHLDRSRELMLIWLKPSGVLPAMRRRLPPAPAGRRHRLRLPTGAARPQRRHRPRAPAAEPAKTGAAKAPPPLDPLPRRGRGKRRMMRDTRIRRLPMALSALVALALAVIPLPSVLDPLRPDFLVLVVFYWSIESPRAGGLALAFIAGLALDVIKGVVLGSTRTGVDVDGRMGHAFAAATACLFRGVAVADHICLSDRLSIHLVLGRWRDRQSGYELQPLAGSGDRRSDLAAARGHFGPLA